MYSVVLMMAITSGGETPDCGRKHGGCHGGGYSCGGGCWGGGYGGCHGSSYGGCYGGGYGGCYGSSYGSPYGGCYGGAIYSAPVARPEDVKKMPKPEETAAPAPAKIIVSLPADAKLTFDGTPTTSTSAERVFETPNLTPNRDYQYTLRAEVMRDGKPVRVEQTVQVRAGRESRVIMALPQGVAAR